MNTYDQLVDTLQRERRRIARAKMKKLIDLLKVPTGHALRVDTPTGVIRRQRAARP